MDRIKALHEIFNALIAKWNLHDWRLEVVPSKSMPNRAAGVCYYSSKLIRMSDEYVAGGIWESVMDTLRHEVAHALSGIGAGHGPVWRRWARIVGANPKASRCVTEVGEEYIRNNYKYRLAAVYECGRVELLDAYGKRRTCLDGRSVVGRPDTLNKLKWIPL